MSKKNTKQSLRVIAVITLIGAAALSAFLAVPLTAIGDPPPGPPVISDDQMQTPTTTVGGAQVLQTTRTVPHWSGSTLDPRTGVTYGYNMVGANPNNCSGTDCDVTVTVDIIPLNVTVADEAFNGTEVVAATVASPVFALNDYGSTPFACSGQLSKLAAFHQGSGRSPFAERRRQSTPVRGRYDALAFQPDGFEPLPSAAESRAPRRDQHRYPVGSRRGSAERPWRSRREG